MKSIIPVLYKQYFIDKGDTRDDLFKLLKEKYKSEKVLYPGSFVHVTPSLYFHDVTYVDNDKRMTKFFNDPILNLFLCKRKEYSAEHQIRSIKADFTKPLPLKEGEYDLMISLYAGFISQYCKKYLKPDGILIVNNSHGDASLAFSDKDYQLVGIIKRKVNRFSLIEKDLDSYFHKKDGTLLNRKKVESTMRGESFTKTGYAYVFRKKSPPEPVG